MRVTFVCLCIVLVCAAACGSDVDPGALPPANAAINIAGIDFALSDWRYTLSSDANSAKLRMVASNGNTCTLMANPNAPNTRLVYIQAFSYTDTSKGTTQAPTGPGLYPIEALATLGPAGSAEFSATGPSSEPLALTNLINPTAPFASNGNVTLTTFDPNALQAGVSASAVGTVTGTSFNYVYTAIACP